MNKTTAEIRQSFIDFFKDNEHQHLPSSPVIPFDDPTLLFVNAGMNQFKDIFTGRKKPEFPRAVTVQKCMRAGGKHNDLENVGRTGRHQTFFEMLGNFSFGDYFKERAIVLAWDWITKHLKLPIDRLYASVYEEDDEAFKLWEKVAPELKNGRIMRFGRKDNFWAMGETGPCGPCSEIHFDRGEKFGTGPEDVVNGEGERFVEFWNLVFMQYDQKPDGTVADLPKRSVDTGAGLERVTTVVNRLESNYEIDIFKELISAIEDITGAKYSIGKSGVSHRVIADHIRALTFCIADGGGMSNEKQGYVLRRILRRAARHGRLLGEKEPFIYRLVPKMVELMGGVYREIEQKQKHIENVIRAEEESFGRTLDTGLDLFAAAAKKTKGSGGKVIPGEEVFRLYDTYGFPVDLTRVMAEEEGLDLDMEGFQKMMARQQKQARDAARFGGDEGDHVKYMLEEVLRDAVPPDAVTEFVRDSFELNANLIDILELGQKQSGEKLVAIIPDQTPFYVEAGGQASDFGTIEHELFRADIKTVYKYKNIIVHVGELTERRYNDIEEVKSNYIRLVIDKERRWDIMRNHTATHLLHAALRRVLGKHVQQSGSYVGPDKLRFDFSHFKPLTPKELNEVEQIINETIVEGLPVETEIDSLENARKSGAMAIFGEKYDSRVRVVSVDDFSKELCGGTHVDNIAKIGPLMVILETGIAAGVRRIEAVTGREAVARMLRDKYTIGTLAEITNRPSDEIVEAVKGTLDEVKTLQKENKKLKAERFSGGSQQVGTEIDLGKLKYYYNDFGNADPEEMAGWVDSFKGSNGAAVAVATGIADGKPTFMAAASGASKKLIHVGNIAREVLGKFGGRGGGKENFARGTFPDNMDQNELFREFENRLKESI